MAIVAQNKGVSLLVVFLVLALSGARVGGVAFAQGTPAPGSSLSSDDALAQIASDDGVVRLDMAEDATRFVPTSEPAHEDGTPNYGTSFVTQGYLYPEGTLSESDGVLADGSPEFPDEVVGQWTCRGWYIADGHHTTTGPMVVTTQIYNIGGEARLGGEFGVAMITTDGYELADVGVEVQRSITGGTGEYAGARGVQRQTLLGLNATEGVNLRIEIDLSDADV